MIGEPGAQELDADEVPQIRVYNKIDRLARRPAVNRTRSGAGRAAWISAATGEGVPGLLEAIDGRLARETVEKTIRLGPEQGRQRAKLFQLGAVLNEQACEDGGWILDLKLAERDLRRFMKRENLAPETLETFPGDDPAKAATVN